jgi:hypothetical protein
MLFGIALVLAASFSTPFSSSARAAEPDCPRPSPQTLAFGCVWTGSYYTGSMTLYESGSKSATTVCWDGSPASAVNDAPAEGRARYVFALYHHPGCEKGGKEFGILPPGQADPDLPDVQSYTWRKYG